MADAATPLGSAPPSRAEDAGANDAAAADAGASDAQVAAPAPRRRCGNLRWVPKHCHVVDRESPPDAAYLEESEWLTAHGARAADVKAQGALHMLGAMCRPLSVGPAKEEALLCLYFTKSAVGGGSSVYRGVQRASISAVRSGAVTTLLDVPLSFSNFDSAGQGEEGDETAIFGLQIDTREAAAKIVVAEPRPGECAAAAKRSAEEIAERLQQKPVVPVEIEMMRFDARLLGKICGGVKTHTWSKGAFRSP